MKYIIRKFSKAKWSLIPHDTGDYKNLQADAVTSCLRTSSNTLSVWAVESTDWEDMYGVLAALFSSSDTPTRTDVIIIERDKIEGELGISLVQSDGATPAVDIINNLHYDLVKIDLLKVDAFANLMYLENIKPKNPMIRRFNENEVIRIVKESISNNLIDPEKLKQRWRDRLEQ
ncbi:hypothetical protein [Shewanella sp. DAU305]|uniref:hypothetical protein n=1 Tax=Shewanella sp. DAU305 TaxID=2991940 RepID=UPI002284C0F6|nr:hypothetical protein [Shewanella sp. DAU305]WAL79824.1 hypothetical protein OX890_06670 [Shewanella sp. DAU305]